MSKIHVVIDSTAHASRDLLAKYECLHVVPLTVILGNDQWVESELPCAEMFKMVGEKRIHPKTSQPAPGNFASVFRPILAEGGEIIVITMSGQLSGTVQSARTASQLVDKNKIDVVDSGTTAMGMIKMAEAALHMASQGMARQDIVERLGEMVRATHTLFIPNTLEYLHKGGRIGGAAALFGAILQIKPILYLTEGKVAILDKVRTRRRAVARMVAELKKQPQVAYIGVGYMSDESEAEVQSLARELRQAYPGSDVMTSELSSVLGAHLGPGLVGIIYQQIL